MLRLSPNISTLFTALPLPERFAAAARARFTAVEMQFPYTHKPAELAAAARSAGVSIILINMPAGNFATGERGIACIPGREAEFQSTITQAIHYATALHCKRINCLAGNMPEGADAQKCWDILVANLRDAADAFAIHNLDLLIEPLNRADNPAFILSGLNEAAALITAIGKSNVSLQYDFYHCAANGDDVFATLTRHASHTGHIQLSDFPGRLAPGTGTLDFARLFRMLRHLPYDGWTGLEYFDSEPDFSWMQNYEISL